MALSGYPLELAFPSGSACSRPSPQLRGDLLRGEAAAAAGWVVVMAPTDDRKIIPVIGNSAVHVGHGLLTRIAAELTPKNGIKASRFVIVSDVNVWALYGQKLVDSFLALGNFKQPSGDGAEVADNAKLLLSYQVEAGEVSKSRKVQAEMVEP